MSDAYGIHWFRRDLRVANNAALQWNMKRTKGKALGVFFFDSQFLSRPDFSNHRFAFFLHTLKSLQEELRELGSDLLVLDHAPDAGFEFLFSKLGSKVPQCVTFSRDYEPFARERDQRVLRKVEERGIEVHTERDHLLIEPRELQKEGKGAQFYQIYTPFCKKWMSLLKEDEFQSRIEIQKHGISYLEKRSQGKEVTPLFQMKWSELLSKNQVHDSLDRFIRDQDSKLKIDLPKAGSLVAYQVAKDFRKRVDGYLENRDFPAKAGTSHLSIYLKNGSITPAMVLNILGIQDARFNKKDGKTQFLKELIWREFYYHILYHRPRVETEAFHSKYNQIAWENREDWFEAWKEGKTGFPIVDAGMRQLKTTGWMHNRVRMIVASFLTKDLLIDWKWGEKYFMNELLDGDLAPNNGGWQWAASTGCDPQPYFRIFNPLLQSKKFDPCGNYIRKFIPELKNVSDNKDIHAPSQKYLSPIVDHAKQKQKALLLYKKL